MINSGTYMNTIIENIISIIDDKIKTGIKAFNTYAPLGTKLLSETILAKKIVEILNNEGYCVIFEELNFIEYFDEDEDEDADHYTYFLIYPSGIEKFPFCIKFINHKAN